MPKVTLWRDGAIETEFDPGHRDWRMGRSETNDITLLDPRKSVSRFHAELREENGRWVFIDLNSQNGSWKDGQRVNRLVLEHGHEVLFGDYKLTFQDIRIPPPPPPPPPLADVQPATADVPVSPDETLLMPGKSQPSGAVKSAAPPPPVVRAAVKTKAPRKGVNPVILILFILAMLGAVAAVAWKVLSSGSAEPAVQRSEPPAREQVQEAPPATTSVTPVAVAEPPPAPPTAATPQQTPGAPATPPAVSATPTSATPGSKAGPEARKAREKAIPPPSRDSPAIVARYDEGRRALGASRFSEAERAFSAVLQQQPGFRDTEALLAQAREGQVSSRQKSLADGRAFEASGDWSRAVAAYERAGAADMASSAMAKMTAAGDDAYRKARQFDARSRAADATAWYERAVQWLPDSDARKATARERLTALKGGGA